MTTFVLVVLSLCCTALAVLAWAFGCRLADVERRVGDLIPRMYHAEGDIRQVTKEKP